MSLLAIFLASLLGSPHCAGMCGGFVALYSSRTPRRFGSHLTYNLGRLTTYVSLGGLLGFFGQELNQFGIVVGVQRLAAVLVGILMLVSGLKMLLSGGNFLSSAPFTHRASGMLAKPLRLLLRERDARGSLDEAFLLGVLSTLLPCGWLYTFLALAAGSGGVLAGMLVMSVFWIGTLPILLSLGSISAKLTGRFAPILPRVTAILVIMAGLFSLFGHFDLGAAHSHIHTL